MKAFDDFVLQETVSESLIQKYKDKVPKPLLEAWGQYGFGSILNGYLRFVNPDDYVFLW